MLICELNNDYMMDNIVFHNLVELLFMTSYSVETVLVISIKLTGLLALGNPTRSTAILMFVNISYNMSGY